jgi:phytoene synthase
MIEAAAGDGAARFGGGLDSNARRQAVRVLDEDRWLAGRFAPKAVRARLDALYLVINEVARAADGVREPLLAQMRLAWWRGALEAMLDGRDAAQPPSVQALAAVHHAVGFDRNTMIDLVEARIAELGPSPFENWAALDAYVDATAGGVIRLAFQAIDPGLRPTPQVLAFTRAAGRAWGYTGLLRAQAFWREQGRSFFPASLADHVALDAEEFRASIQGHKPQAVLRSLMDRAVGGYREAQRLSASLPATLYPGYGYIALTPLYLRILETAPDSEPPTIPLFRRQICLVWKAMRGPL